MFFNVIGWNFRNTPIEVRDKQALTEIQQLDLGEKISRLFNLGGIVILSTCNRTEFYLVNAEKKLDLIIEMLEDYWQLNNLKQSVYTIHNLEALRHLFRVASSLESMVIGEPQILGQLKESFQSFCQARLTGKVLHPLFTRAFSTAKRVRTETSIASNAVSLSYAAVELAKHIFEDLSKQRVMVIGAGEMSELAIRHLMRNGVSELFVTNRTFSSAAQIAEKFKGMAIPFDHLQRYLHEADIIISSTGARQYILSVEMVEESLRKRKAKPMFFIDIALPRDIDPEINKLQGSFCYDIDDLQSVVSENQEERKKQSKKAEEIIDNELSEFELWFKSLSAVPIIRSLRKSFHSIAQYEMAKSFRRMKDMSDVERKEVELMINRMINKLLHDPSINLKKIAHAEDSHLYLDTLIRTFDLNPTPVNLEKSIKKQSRLKIIK